VQHEIARAGDHRREQASGQRDREPGRPDAAPPRGCAGDAERQQRRSQHAEGDRQRQREVVGDRRELA